MVSIIMSSDTMVRWPQSVQVVLDTVGSFLSLKTYAHHFQCALGGTITLAQMYYTHLLLSVLLPIVFLFVSGFYWFFLVPRCLVLRCTKEELIISGLSKTSYPPSDDVPGILAKISSDRQQRLQMVLSKSTLQSGNVLCDAETGRHHDDDAIDSEIDRETNGENVLLSNVFFRNTTLWKTTRDTWVISNVYWTYCVWPSILSNSFGAFACRTICGRVVFAKDENELCFGGQRETFAYAVALPAIVLYLILSPTLMLYYLWKRKSDLKSRPDKARKIMFRYGLFFSGYAERRWFWEIVVVIRKIVLILIVTFVKNKEVELHYALGFVMVVLYIQERERPYQSNSDRTDKNQMRSWLHLTEMISLLGLWTMLWVAELFNLGQCKTLTLNCAVLSFMVLGSNAVFVCVIFFLVLGSFAVAKNRSLVDRCMSCCWKNKKGRGGGGGGDGGGGGGGVDVNVDVEVELTVIGSNAGEEKNKEVVVRSVVNPLVS
jgi:hypothetical protein